MIRKEGLLNDSRGERDQTLEAAPIEGKVSTNCRSTTVLTEASVGLIVDAIKRATVIWSTSERMYSVSSKNRELSVKIADDLPQAPLL